MPNFIDLTGKIFGRLTILGRIGLARDGHITWECLCSCGKTTVVSGNSLTLNKTKSCGCLQKEITTKRMTVHGSARRSKKTRTYNIWIGMNQRCNDPNSNGYHNYGGKNPKIIVCDRWNPKNGGSFENFLEDMGECPSKQYSIDRINNDLGYYKGNCRWATVKQQTRNKRTNIFTDMNNEKLCLEDCLKKYDVAKTTFYRRLNKYNKSREETIKELIKEKLNEI